MTRDASHYFYCWSHLIAAPLPFKVSVLQVGIDATAVLQPTAATGSRDAAFPLSGSDPGRCSLVTLGSGVDFFADAGARSRRRSSRPRPCCGSTRTLTATVGTAGLEQALRLLVRGLFARGARETLTLAWGRNVSGVLIALTVLPYFPSRLWPASSHLTMVLVKGCGGV